MVGDVVGGPGPEAGRPGQVPPGARRLEWRELRRPDRTADRYGVLDMLSAGGVDEARTEVYVDEEDGGVYWVVTLADGRAAVLTDDTEAQVVHLEGPWPYQVTFHGPDGVDTVVDHSIDELGRRVVAWYGGDPGREPARRGGYRRV